MGQDIDSPEDASRHHNNPPPSGTHNPPPTCEHHNNPPPCDNHNSPPPCDSQNGGGSEHTPLAANAAIAVHAGLELGHTDAVAAHVNAHLGNEYASDCSTAIAAHADLGLELGSCGHSAAHDLVTAHVDAHLGDLAHDQLHVTVA